jgi:photosystem II stability/assembly factor-like uncharacterized protein
MPTGLLPSAFIRVHPRLRKRPAIRVHPRLLALVAALAVGSMGSNAQPAWSLQSSGVTARLRGVSAVSSQVAWASGTGGTVIRTADGGRTWKNISMPNAAALDFRDIDAVDERTAYVLSIGNGDASRIYKTSDAGATWTLQFRNEDPKAFFDAMAFRDERHGFAVSDSVDGRFVILRTDDGATWRRVPTEVLPPALDGEGAYAASGTNVAIKDDRVWIATTSRVLRSLDGGRSWTVAATPLRSSASAGIFSIAFRDANDGMIVGGDYKQETAAVDNAAVTSDAGVTWTPINGLSGYRSAVAFVPGRRGMVVAVGPAGVDYSSDSGRTWRALPGPGFHAVSFAPGTSRGWAVGETGAVATIEF